MLHFEYPLAFLLLLLPILVYWLTAEYRDKAEAVRVPFFDTLVSLSDRKPTTGDLLLTKTKLQRFFLVLIWSLIIIALTKPMWVGQPISKEVSARDMLLIVDLSQSMSEKDARGTNNNVISRLDAVKQVLHTFIGKRESDRLGLVVYGNAAYPQVPFTQDHDVLKVLLDELHVGMAGPKTMIGDAIGIAIRMFDKSEAKNKVAILLTDGNDSGSKMPVSKAAKIAAGNSIVFHTIAMGDPETVGEKQLDIATLKNISELTKGKFFEALNLQELDAVYEELDRIEPELLETISYRPKSNLYHYPIALSFILMLIISWLELGVKKVSISTQSRPASA